MILFIIEILHIRFRTFLACYLLQIYYIYYMVIIAKGFPTVNRVILEYFSL